MNENTIMMTWPDHAQLSALLQTRRDKRNGLDCSAFDRLAGELARARLIAAHDIPQDVVTMNTTARVRDLDADAVLTLTLSWPADASPENNRINVLAPLGMALLGCRAGQSVQWPVPGGIRRLRIEEVLHQPENDRLPPEAC